MNTDTFVESKIDEYLKLPLSGREAHIDWLHTTLQGAIEQGRREERERVISELSDYIEHSNRCIRSQCHQGRPTKDGGYETQFGSKWYRTTPVDESPKCDCGLSEVLTPSNVETERNTTSDDSSSSNKDT